ncbi:hypothetical protein V6N11_043690 [Hibiscus sabdariffa]|uniref:Uncharacterized protein n=1 Tax=Hibiscus sabdariffa TaxID=183260 RepID=A0ABR2RDQ9_9ROSI
MKFIEEIWILSPIRHHYLVAMANEYWFIKGKDARALVQCASWQQTKLMYFSKMRLHTGHFMFSGILVLIRKTRTCNKVVHHHEACHGVH